MHNIILVGPLYVQTMGLFYTMDFHVGTLIMQMRLNYRRSIVYSFIFIILMADSARAYQMCSWIGSFISFINRHAPILLRLNKIISLILFLIFGQSSSANEENVQVVRLNCDRGEVAWRYSRGALIVRIQAPNFNAADHPNARICYRLSKNHRNVLLYNMQESSTSQGLSLLFNDPEKTDDDHVTCKPLPFNGLVNLFMELRRQHSRSIQNSRASFYYEIFRNSAPLLAFDPAVREGSASNCGQCTMHEALKSYCSSSSNFKGTFVHQNRNIMRFSVENEEQKSKEIDIFTSNSCINLSPKQVSSFFVATNEYLGRLYLSCLIEWEKFRKMLEKTKNGGESYCTNLELLQ